MTTIFLARICFSLLAFGLVATSLTLTARLSWSAPRRAQEQGGMDAKQSSSEMEANETSPEKKFVSDPLSEYTPSPPRGSNLRSPAP